MGLLGHAEHNQARAQVIGGRLIYTARGCADYTLLLPGGIYAACEAKSTKRDVLLRSEVAAKQADHLERVASAGGVAFLLLEYRHDDRPPTRFSVPWNDVPWKIRRSAPSVAEEDVARWSVRVGTCYLEPYVKGRLERTSLPQRRFPRE